MAALIHKAQGKGLVPGALSGRMHNPCGLYARKGRLADAVNSPLLDGCNRQSFEGAGRPAFLIIITQAFRILSDRLFVLHEQVMHRCNETQHRRFSTA